MRTIDNYWLDNGEQEDNYLDFTKVDSLEYCEKILNSIDIKFIEQYLRKKKLEKVKRSEY